MESSVYFFYVSLAWGAVLGGVLLSSVIVSQFLRSDNTNNTLISEKDTEEMEKRCGIGWEKVEALSKKPGELKNTDRQKLSDSYR